VRNVFIDHLKSAASKRAICLLGIEARPIENVVISNGVFENATKPNIVEHIDKLVFENVMQRE
jgi:hypothetical protein